MAKQNRSTRQDRATLKNFFADGSLPSAAQFGSLIDSTLNMKDEGFSRSPEYGVEISAIGTSTGLLSFFRDSQPLTPVWSIRFDDYGRQNLTFNFNHEDYVPHDPAAVSENGSGGAASEPALTLNSAGRIGVQKSTPDCELDVNGTLRCATRLGTVPDRFVPHGDADSSEAKSSMVDQSVPVPADGQWHNITSAMTGCQALEVVAGVGKKDTGRYAILHAIALNTFNPSGFFFNFLRLKNRIKCRQAYYRSRSDKLALRWHGEQRNYYLQIRSNSDYGLDIKGEPIRINYHITNLWTDPRMARSWDVQDAPLEQGEPGEPGELEK